MATTTPPKPPTAPPPRDPPPRPARPARGRFVRPLAVGALALVVLIVAYLVFAGGGGSTYKLEFAEADQLVRGDQVQVGGVPVGSVKNIELTHDFKALVTIHVNSSLVPLHAGTVAQVRVPSLSSVANRYIALSPGPNNAPALAAGAKLPASATRNVTDLDQLFNTLEPEDAQGPAAVHPGHRRTVRRPGQVARRSDRILRAVADRHRPLLRRARARPVDVHELPRGNRQGRDDDRRAQGRAQRPDRKRQHDVHGDRLRADEPRPGAQSSCRSRCARATARSPTCRRRSAR